MEKEDNWPKHPNGTNMTIGEMPIEDKKRILANCAKRYKEKCAKHERPLHFKMKEFLDRLESWNV